MRQPYHDTVLPNGIARGEDTHACGGCSAGAGMIHAGLSWDVAGLGCDPIQVAVTSPFLRCQHSSFLRKEVCAGGCVRTQAVTAALHEPLVLSQHFLYRTVACRSSKLNVRAAASSRHSYFKLASTDDLNLFPRCSPPLPQKPLSRLPQPES